MRTILFTGKGGVGKTTVAAATALRCAEELRRGSAPGRAGARPAGASTARVAIMSTDPAHSLADSFDCDLDSSFAEVAPGVVATQMDATARMEENWGEIRSYLREVFQWAGLDEIEAEELSIIPGLEEIFALSDITAIERSGEFDVLIVDCAPTAETIRFLSLPDVLSWYMDRAFPLSRRLTATLGPVVEKLAAVPVAGDHVFGAVERMYRQLDDVRALLRDGERSSVRLVVNPERMVIAEARRTYTYLSLFGYRTDAVVVNRLFPEAITDPWFDRWKDLQATHLAEVLEGFDPVPVLRAHLADTEVVGVERLAALGAELYADHEASAVLLHDDPMRIERTPQGFVLTLDLPFASRDNLEITRTPTELFCKVGPYRRSVLLPDSLRRLEIVRAGLKHGRLSVRFE